MLLASVFDQAAPEDQRYEEVNREFYRKPSPEMLEAFLEAAPGGHAVHLGGLFDGLKGGMDSQTRSSLARLLRGLGHGDEAVYLLLPERPE